MNVTIKLSGHVLFPSIESSPKFDGYADVVKSIKNSGHNPFVVVGGGWPARYYIKIARSNGMDESTCDQMGISAANINARIFARSLGDAACHSIPTDFEMLDYAISTGKIVVMGGLQPGQSTNAVAAMLAERSDSKLFINTTTVDGLYDSDPKTNPSARKLPKVGIKEVASILAKSSSSNAGQHELLDNVAIKIIERSSITTRIIDGTNPENIKRALTEEIGTTITP